MAARPKARDIDEYIAAFSPEVQSILQKVRSTIREAAPQAEERISYAMPAFALGGRILIYFAAFKNHIGLYPPVNCDEKINKAVARYAGPKGNLQFALDEAIPYALIKRIVTYRVKEQQRREASK
jgi:uncharacterized protein YdhG (YjbR/CyaY superfamily)